MPSSTWKHKRNLKITAVLVKYSMWFWDAVKKYMKRIIKTKHNKKAKKPLVHLLENTILHLSIMFYFVVHKKKHKGNISRQFSLRYPFSWSKVLVFLKRCRCKVHIIKIITLLLSPIHFLCECLFMFHSYDAGISYTL